MDGKSVILHSIQDKVLHPNLHIGFWGWAYRCITQISLVTSEFVDECGIEYYASYYPCLTIWSIVDKNTYSYVLLKNYERDTEQVPLFCFCSTDWKPIESNTMQVNTKKLQDKYISFNPIIMQFLQHNHEKSVSQLFGRTTDLISKGISIRPSTNISVPYSREEIIFDNSEISLALSFHSGYYSPELLPLLGEWKDFFISIIGEKGILPSNSPIISHNTSANEIYEKVIKERKYIVTEQIE
jgi:hypothetical protein